MPIQENVSLQPYNSFGIKSAAQTYFNTSPAKLTPAQAALLIGMLKGPSLYSPIRHPDNALRRRNTVLAMMQKAGYLGATETAEMQSKDLELKLITDFTIHLLDYVS